MLRFLTDEHISPAVAGQIGLKFPDIKIVALRDWHDGRYLGAEDAVFIQEAAKEGLTLVSYDQKTIRPLLKAWVENGTRHAGIVFVDEKTIAPQNIGRLAEALHCLWKSESRADWTDRVVFLRRVNEGD